MPLLASIPLPNGRIGVQDGRNPHKCNNRLSSLRPMPFSEISTAVPSKVIHRVVPRGLVNLVMFSQLKAAQHQIQDTLDKATCSEILGLSRESTPPIRRKLCSNRQSVKLANKVSTRAATATRRTSQLHPTRDNSIRFNPQTAGTILSNNRFSSSGLMHSDRWPASIADSESCSIQMPIDRPCNSECQLAPARFLRLTPPRAKRRSRTSRSEMARTRATGGRTTRRRTTLFRTEDRNSHPRSPRQIPDSATTNPASTLSRVSDCLIEDTRAPSQQTPDDFPARQGFRVPPDRFMVRALPISSARIRRPLSRGSECLHRRLTSPCRSHSANRHSQLSNKALTGSAPIWQIRHGRMESSHHQRRSQVLASRT